MKITAIILSVFILQTKASFYDDITGAMSSVEDAFGKLLNDVVSDVKNTVHCTILAMEQVLVISGAVTEPTTSDQECPDGYGLSVEDERNNKMPLDNFTGAKEKDKYFDEYSNGDYSERIHSSISKVNKTLNHIFDTDGHERLRDIRKMFKNETDRLTEVSRLLRQELDKISYRIKNEVFKMNSNKKSLESLWDDMKILHELEMRDKNVTEVNEISQVLNEAMGVLNLDSKNMKSDDDKMKFIMQELQQESLNNTGTHNSTINTLYEWDENKSNLQNFSAYEAPKVADILTEKENDSKEMLDHTTHDTSIYNQNNKASPENYQFEQITPPSQSVDSPDLDYLSMIGAKSAEEREKVIDNAKNIINKNSADADAILDKLFSNQGGNAREILNYTTHDTSIYSQNNKASPENYQFEQITPLSQGADSTDLDYLSRIDAVSAKEREKVIDNAKDVIKSGADADAILDKLFSNQEDNSKEMLDHTTYDTSIYNQNNKASPENYQFEQNTPPSVDSPDLDYLSMIGAVSPEEREKVIDNAKDIIKNSADADAILDKLFSNQGGNSKGMFDYTTHDTAIKIQDNEASAEKYQFEQTAPPSQGVDSTDLDYLSMIGAVSPEEREKVIDNAKDIMKDGADADAILDKLFSNQGGNLKGMFDYTMHDTAKKIQDNEASAEKYQFEQTAPPSQGVDSTDLDYLSRVGAVSPEEREKVIDNAKDIIKDGADADSILDKLFSNQEDNSKEMLDHTTHDTSIYNQNNKASPENYQFEQNTPPSVNSPVLDYLSMFGAVSPEEREKVIDNAKDIIKNSADADAILDKLFSNQGGNLKGMFDYTTHDTAIKIQDNEASAEKYQFEQTAPPSQGVDSTDLDYLSRIGAVSPEEREKVIDNAKDIIKDGADADAILDKLFSNQGGNSKEIFDHTTHETAIKIQDNKSSAENYQFEQTAPPSQGVESTDLDYLSRVGAVSPEEREKVIDNAKDIIKDGADADAILDKLFSNQESNSKFVESVFSDQEYQT